MSAPLLAITDRRRMGADPIARAVELMERLRDRVIVQVREPDLEARELYEWAKALDVAARRTRARIFVHRRLDVALSFAPEVGLHLQERGVGIAEARRLLPQGTPLSAATHDLAGALLRVEAGADLITVAPVFPTASKPETLRQESPVLGLVRLAEIVRAVGGRAKVYALGGIDRGNVDRVLETGVDGVAAISAAWSRELEAGS